MGDLTSTILLGVALVFLMVLSFVFQGFRTRRAPLGKVVGIASNVRYNEKHCDSISENRSTGRFKTSAWDKHRESVDFLPVELRNELSDLFESIAEINVSVDTASKLGSASYISAVDIDKLRAPLASCKEQLQEWVYANMNNPKYLPKKRGLFHR